jgi:quinol monooxygenase YgiN
MAGYCLFISFRAASDNVETLRQALSEGSRLMAAAGCRLHLVSQDMGRPDTVWVVEVWDSKAAHDAAVALPAAAALTERVLALCEAVGSRVETTVVGGLELATTA